MVAGLNGIVMCCLRIGLRTSSRQENSEENTKSIIQGALKKTFSPEFLNRIDDIVIFNSLDKDHIFSIIEINLKHLFKRMNNLEFELSLTDEAKSFVAEKGYDPQFGARPLNRAIQKYIEDPLAEFILNENPEKGSKLLADINEDKSGLTIALYSEANTHEDIK